MDEVPANRQSFPGQGAATWIDAYQEEMLQARDEATIETYTRVLEKFTAWLALRPGNSGQFRPQAITRTAIEGFLETLPSYSYKKHARVALSGFCRLSDVSWLLLDQVHMSRKAGWMTVEHKGGKERTIDLVNQARSPLYDYFQQGERKASAYVFTSQRVKKSVSAEEVDGWRWTEDGIHQ